MATPSDNLWSTIFLVIFGKDGKRGVIVPLGVVIAIILLSEMFIGGLIAIILDASALVALAFYILFVGLREVPADPYTIAAMKLFGNYTGGTKGPGTRFYPPGFSSTDIPITLVNKDIELETKVTDRSTIAIKVGITFKPDAGSLVNFIKAGKQEGVFNIFNDVVSTAIRQWAASQEEGPATWVDAVSSHEEALVVLLRSVNGDILLGENVSDIEEIRDILQKIDVPLVIIYKHRTYPHKKPNEIEAGIWGGIFEGKPHPLGKNVDWELFDERMTMLTADENVALNKCIKNLRARLMEARQGNANIPIKDSGIILTRLNIKEIMPVGAVADAADKEAKEVQERRGEEVELRHVANRINELTIAAGIPRELAAEIVQTERGKVIKNIQENKYKLSPEVLATLAQVAASFFGRGGNNP